MRRNDATDGDNVWPPRNCNRTRSCLSFRVRATFRKKNTGFGEGVFSELNEEFWVDMGRRMKVGRVGSDS